MTIIAALLVCLAVKVIYAVELECRNVVSCPCGSSGENVTVCMPDASAYAEVCTRLSKCESCEEDSNVCLKCLEGLEGITCSQEKSKSRQKRQMYYQRRIRPKARTGYRQNCPNIDSPKLGSIRCVSGSDQQTCTGTCLPGYHFTSGTGDEMTLTCQRGVWTPRTSFPDCRSGGHCDLIVTGAGAFNCTTGMDGTRCDVICSGRYAGRFYCYPGREWEPPLPRCVKPKHGDTGGRTACTCKHGGTCDGNGKCACTSDWMGNECEIAVPKKRSCQDPGFVPNGFRHNPDGSEAMHRQSFEEGQSVMYYCNSEEYALQGSSILTCKSDGTWSRSLPNCIKTATAAPELVCQDPGHRSNSYRLNPDGSRVIGVSRHGKPAYAVGHSLAYTCHEGFALQGQSLITCLASGQWSSRTPYCTRIVSPAPVTEKTTKPTPEQKFCKDPRVDLHGIREPRNPPDRRGFPAGTLLEYSCEPGYDLIGASTLFCLIQGYWSTDRPRCASQSRNQTPKPLTYCPYPGDITNGRVLHVPTLNERRRPSEERDEEYPEGSRLQYSCIDGYILEGPASVTCENTGEWSASPPTCVLAPRSSLTYCQYPGDIANGRVFHIHALNERRRPSDETEEEYPEGSRLQYSCEDGYELEGSATITCQNTGRWSSRPPTCKEVSIPLTYCQYLGDIANGRVFHVPTLNERRRPFDEREKEYPEGSRLQYSCDNEYSLEGSDTLTCESTGRWSSSLPSCKKEMPLTCEIPRRFHNGKVVHRPVGQTVSASIQDDDVYLEGSRLDYSCNAGYTLVGPPTLVCEETGFWSAEPPICRRNRNRPVACKHPGIVGNAQVVHIPPSEFGQVTSNEGWEEYPPGSQLQYTCEQGYMLEGTFVLYCQNNGSWTAKPPTCINDVPAEIMYCDNPGMTLNGKVQYYPPAIKRRSGQRQSPDYDLPEYPEQAVLEYSCDEGYLLQGRRTITCQSTGFWNGDTPQCVPDCGRSYIQTHHRVMNGSKTISGDWPWVVSISVEEPDGSTSFVCGGAVINTHTVITAAHCLSGPVVDGKTLILRFGKHNFKIEDDDDQVLVRRSSRTIVHPDYSNRTIDSDIGLVIFQQRIRYSHLVQPLCLPTRDTTLRNIEEGTVGYVGGWGLTEDAVNPDVMMLASLPVVSDRKCMDAYRQQNLIITSNMFCAGYEDARQSVCSGDSGSPFVFYDKRKERYTLEGLVSFGVRGQCGVAGKYAIFTKVFRFLTWILRNSK